MTEIILKTNAPDKAAHILKEALATEASRIKYSLNLAKKRLERFESKYNISSAKFINEWSAEDIAEAKRAWHEELQQEAAKKEEEDKSGQSDDRMETTQENQVKQGPSRGSRGSESRGRQEKAGRAKKGNKYEESTKGPVEAQQAKKKGRKPKHAHH